MLRKILSGLVVGVFVLGVAGHAAAQGQGPQVQYKKETRYDFEDDVVEGELQRPDEMMLDVRRKARHSSLIKVREDFVPELVKSAENI